MIRAIQILGTSRGGCSGCRKYFEESSGSSLGTLKPLASCCRFQDSDQAHRTSYHHVLEVFIALLFFQCSQGVVMSSRTPFPNYLALRATTSLCSQCRRKAQSRFFSSTPRPSTRLRVSMFRWLNGPGQAFKDPLPGSTNYLNAYNPQGHLIRARNETTPTKESGPDDTGGSVNSGPGQLEKNIAGGKPIPKETADDLMPFPMNRQFRSQPVLSEELRDAVYDKIIREGWSVRKVSAFYGIDMQRVGAVVRLKTIENQWVQEVR